MRSNMPVTNVEYVLKDSQFVFSTADLRGNITYTNQDLINISGFGEAELIGQPHNILRHPDMPAEVFADFWRTIEAGRAWTGLVKNRCKNGDYYWVEANTAPAIERHKIVGYASTQTKPSREQVQAAERAYRAIKGGDTSIEIRQGRVIKRTFLNRYRLLQKLSLKTMLAIAAGSVGALFVGIGTLAWLATSGDGRFYLNWLMASSAIGVPMAVVFGVASYRSVVRPLQCATDEIERMCAGDLTGRIVASGIEELAQLMHSLRVLQINIKQRIGQIKESTDLVTSGAHEIASGSADLSSRTESQASSLDQTANSMEELTSTVKQNTGHAQHASSLVSATANIAVQGGKLVGQVIANMGSIKESSRKIAEITGVIDGIAFQTNILALNAAVEAARAGAQGRGFAVVAAEVRNLAQRSAVAAKEIKTLIASSGEQVETGRKLVDEAGESMEDIVTSVQLVEDIIGGTATSSQEQSSSIEQVNRAIAQMDQITQENAALVEQAAAAAEGLQDQAAKLTKIVGYFKLVRMGQTWHKPVSHDNLTASHADSNSEASAANRPAGRLAVAR